MLAFSVLAFWLRMVSIVHFGGDPSEMKAIQLGTTKWRLLGEPTCIALSADGALIAIATNSFCSQLLDSETGLPKCILNSPPSIINSFRRSCLAFSPDGRWLVTERNHELFVWDFKSKRLFRKLECPKKKWELSPNITGLEAENEVSTVAHSLIGSVAAGIRSKASFWANDSLVGETEENIIVVFPSSGEKYIELKGHQSEIMEIRFSADGTTIVSLDRTGTVHWWDIKNGQQKRKWKPKEQLNGCRFSPDGVFIAGISGDSIWIYETSTGKVRTRLKGVYPQVTLLAFSWNNTLLAATGGTSIQCWNLASGISVQSSRLAAPATCMAFSVDGHHLYSGHQREHLIRSWDVATMHPAVLIDGHVEPVFALSFATNGKRLISSTLADDFRSWDICNRKTFGAKEAQQQNMAIWLESAVATSSRYCEAVFTRNHTENAAGDVFSLPASRQLLQLNRLPSFLSRSVNGRELYALMEKESKRLTLIVKSPEQGRLCELMWEDFGNFVAALSPDGEKLAVLGGSGLYLAPNGKRAHRC